MLDLNWLVTHCDADTRLFPSNLNAAFLKRETLIFNLLEGEVVCFETVFFALFCCKVIAFEVAVVAWALTPENGG